MVKGEEYTNFLNTIIECINHADHEAIKELSNLELENINKKEKNNIRKSKKIIKKEELSKEELLKLIDKYSEYILNNTNKNIKTIDEFFVENI